jgi:hypothetical protein
MAKRKLKPAREKIDPLIDRERLLAEFGLITEKQLAVLLGVDIKTLKNRPRSELPVFSRTGRQRLFHKDAVQAYLAKTVPSPTQAFRVRKRAADDRVAP